MILIVPLFISGAKQIRVPNGKTTPTSICNIFGITLQNLLLWILLEGNTTQLTKYLQAEMNIKWAKLFFFLAFHLRQGIRKSIALCVCVWPHHWNWIERKLKSSLHTKQNLINSIRYRIFFCFQFSFSLQNFHIMYSNILFFFSSLFFRMKSCDSTFVFFRHCYVDGKVN